MVLFNRLVLRHSVLDINWTNPRLGYGCGTSSDETCSTGGTASGMRGGLSSPRRRLSGTWESEASQRLLKEHQRCRLLMNHIPGGE
jgi:hypothetical protein